jgi:hypothetical protein
MKERSVLFPCSFNVLVSIEHVGVPIYVKDAAMRWSDTLGGEESIHPPLESKGFLA